MIAFYKTALDLGTKDEGAPGFRGGSPFFMSYVRDLDGNKLYAYHEAKAVWFFLPRTALWSKILSPVSGAIAPGR